MLSDGTENEALISLRYFFNFFVFLLRKVGFVSFYHLSSKCDAHCSCTEIVLMFPAVINWAYWTMRLNLTQPPKVKGLFTG
jgi:hypothetical protein